jgi:hypothetical protein
MRCVRAIAGHAGLAGPPANTHRASQAYLLEPARTSQASAGVHVANPRKRASRDGRFSCAYLHPYRPPHKIRIVLCVFPILIVISAPIRCRPPAATRC